MLFLAIKFNNPSRLIPSLARFNHIYPRWQQNHQITIESILNSNKKHKHFNWYDQRLNSNSLLKLALKIYNQKISLVSPNLLWDKIRVKALETNLDGISCCLMLNNEDIIPLDDSLPASRCNQWIVLVPNLIPGESALVEIVSINDGYSIGKIVEIIHPSPKRSSPPCPVYQNCSGCQLQHVSYENQLKWKQENLQLFVNFYSDYLTISSNALQQIIPCRKHFGYRTKLSPSSIKCQDGNYKFGLISRWNQKEVIDVESCKVVTDEINETFEKAKRDGRHKRRESLHPHLFRESLVPPSNSKLSQIVLSKDGTTYPPESINGIEWSTTITTQKKEISLAIVDGLAFRFMNQAYFRTNPYLTTLLVRHVKQQLSTKSQDTKLLLDTYSGSGLFGISCAHLFDKVYAIESEKSTSEWSSYNASDNKIDNFVAITSAAEKMLDKIPKEKSCMIINPNHSGTSLRFLSTIPSILPEIIVYISTDLNTMFDDLENLQKFVKWKYEISNISSFDMFPQSHRFETCITLRLRNQESV